MADALTVKFWGVRGSYPTPGAGTVKYGGNTACVEITARDKTLILDAGTGIIPLGSDLARCATARKQLLEVVLLFSHLHHDHTQGFPFFTPAYLPNAKLHIFGPGVSPESLEKVLENNQSPTTFPVGLREMAASKDIRSLRETQVIVWNETGVRVTDNLPIGEAGKRSDDETLVVHIQKSYAHPGGVYVYRISWHGQSVVYATDTEGYVGTDRRLVQFARGANLLIHDAQYGEEHYSGQRAGFPSTQGYGHSTATMACEVAAAAKVGMLILFHHDPAYDDGVIDEIERKARVKFEKMVAAYEGLTYTISSPPKGAGVRLQRRVKYAQDGRDETG
jgi:phosphoribosyl 1,2-cyclic phosphodiesterase